VIDKKDRPVVAGAKCLFYVEGRDAWVGGIVRVVRESGVWAGHARVDDGDPANDDLHTNGFHVSAWVPSDEIEVLP
jgi:hypothetical protein